MDGVPSAPGTACGDGPLGWLAQVLAAEPAPGAVEGGGFLRPGLFVALLGWLPEAGPGADAVLRERDAAVASCLAELRARRLCVSAQAIGAGGLLGALVAACAAGRPRVGCSVVLPPPRDGDADLQVEIERQLRDEAPGRWLLAIEPLGQADARLLAAGAGVPLWPLGRTSGGEPNGELIVRAALHAEVRSFAEVLRVRVADFAPVVPVAGATPPL